MRRKLIPYLIITIILLQVALSEDFTAYSSTDTINACPCSIIGNKILVRNDGFGTYQYSITQSGDASEWSTIFPDSFILDPQETQNIESFLKIPCDASGRYELTTDFANNIGIKKQLVQEVNVNECSNIDIVSAETEITTCPCTTETLEFTLRNSGSYTEIYDFYTESDLDFTISEKSVILAPGESKTIYLYFSSSCEEFGEFSARLSVESRYNEEKKDIDLGIDIQACYEFNVAFGEATDNFTYTNQTFGESEYSLCEAKDVVIPFAIKNTANIKNNYNIYLEGPIWANLRYEKINNLTKDETFFGLIDLFIDPYQEGTYDLNLMIVTDLGGLVKEYTIPVEVNWCTTAGIGMEKKYKVNHSEEYLAVDIENLGIEQAKYNLLLEGPEWVTLGREFYQSNVSNQSYIEKIDTLDIEPEEKVALWLISQPGNMTPEGDYQVNLSVATADQTVPYTKSTEISLHEKNILDTLIYYSWYILLALILLLLLIFLIKLNLDKKQKKDPEQKTINESVVQEERLEPLSKKKLRKKRNYSWVWILIALLLLLILVFCVWRYAPINWQTNNQVTTNETINQTITNVSINDTQEIIQPENETILQNDSGQIENHTNATEEEITEEVSFEGINCTFETSKNEVILLNMSDYFIDPDGDSLNFDYTLVPSHTTVNISGDLITLTPQQDFVGLDFVEFSADDMKGGTINSGKLTICVYEEKEDIDKYSAFKNFIYSYLYYIIAGIIILVIIIVIMVINEKGKHDYKETNNIKLASAKKKKKAVKKKKKRKK